MIRLKELREKQNLTQTALAKKIGLVPSSISQYESETRLMSHDVQIAIADYFGVSIDYLLGRSEERNTLDSKYPSVSIIRLPVMYTVAAGFDKRIIEDDNRETQEVPASLLNGHNSDDLFVFAVRGDSMSPKFLDGDRVLVVRQSSVDSGDIAIVAYNDCEDGTIKKVLYEPNCDYIDLIPANSAYSPIRIQGEDLEGVRIIGKVIYLFRKI